MRAIAIVLLINALLATVIPSLGKPTMLPIYTMAAERIVRGEEIYRPSDEMAFAYPPFLVLPAVPLVPLSPLMQARVWWFINLCLLDAILVITARMVWPTLVARENATVARDNATAARENATDSRGNATAAIPRWVLPAMVAALAGRFVASPLEYQSHDLIVFATIMLAGYALSQRRDALAGTWAGLAAACKATPLLFLPVFCWQRRWRAAACCVVALLLATLLPDLLFPSRLANGRPGRPWVVHWYDEFISKVPVDAPPQATGAWVSWNVLNQSLSSTVYRLTTPVETHGYVINVCLVALRDSVRRRLTLGLELLVVGWLAWCTWPRRLEKCRPPCVQSTLRAVPAKGG
jgi:hypothetical protein